MRLFKILLVSFLSSTVFLVSAMSQEIVFNWRVFTANDQSSGCYLASKMSYDAEFFVYANANEAFVIGLTQSIDSEPFEKEDSYELYLDGKLFIQETLSVFKPNIAFFAGVGSEEQGWEPIIRRSQNLSLLVKDKLFNLDLKNIPLFIDKLWNCVGGSGVSDDEDRLNDTDEMIIAAEGNANNGCRGGDPSTLEMYGECRKRDLYGAILARRGYCYGKMGEAGYQERWHQCSLGSNWVQYDKQELQWIPW